MRLKRQRVTPTATCRHKMSGASYELLAECTVAGVLVQKFRSTRTGLVVCIAHVEGPLVNGYFCLATEAHDDDGLPHTLEHLIFMGSEQYPYKGVLDQLANRCLAQGTNAWTDVDHTCYTVMTAGSQGFLNLLPVYLDHVLYPTLTDAAYLTEVHHVNGEGEDAGVVYCEMQARENTGEELSSFLLLRHMYPGDSGYKSNTGGKMSNLRESCSNEKVRKYHQVFYRPDNLCLIVTGQVEATQLFQAVQPFEEKILRKGELPPLQRPWQSPIDPLTSSVTEELVFPTDEEADGLTRMSWRGPPAVDRYRFTASTTLLEYLSEGPVAPLMRDMVEVEEPFCSEISQSVFENSETCLGFTFSGVPTKQLPHLEKKVREVLGGIAEGREEVDMERMGNIVRRQMLNIRNNVESSPHHYFAFALIGDFLFSKAPNELSSYLDQLPFYRRLLEEPSQFWTSLLSSLFTQAPHIMVLARPSHEEAVKMAAEEEERIEKQREALGEQALQEKEEQLQKAMQENEIPCPTDVVGSVPVPGTDCIFFHPLVSMGNHQSESELVALSEYQQFPLHQLPFFFHLNHIHSSFVELQAILNTEGLPLSLHRYLPLYLELLFESSVTRDGVVIPYEVVVKELERDTVETSACLGYDGKRFVCGEFPSAVFISLKVEREKYARGVQWLFELLYCLQFTADRLSVVATKMVNDVARMKRKGNRVCHTLLKHILFTADSPHNTANMVMQLQFLEKQLQKLKDPATVDLVISDMTSVRDTLTSLANLRVVMATDVGGLSSSDPLEPWAAFVEKARVGSIPSPSSLPHIHPSHHTLHPSSAGKTLIAGVGGVESNYLVQSIPCIKSHDHPDYPAILVFIEYLTALEGPMWRQIRGMGLSYHYNISCNPSQGLLSLVLYKSAQLVQAYDVARKIVSDHVHGEVELEQVPVEAAISGVIYQVIEEGKTVADAADQAVLQHLRAVAPTFSKELLGKVSKVTITDLKRVGKEYFKLLLEPTTVSTAVCCNPTKVTEIKTGLEGIGHTVQVVEDVDSIAS